MWGFVGVSEPVGFLEGSGQAWAGYNEGLSWRQKARISSNASAYEVYGVSLYVALNNIFGGSCDINPGNYIEFYVQAAMLLIGSSVWAYVIGSACGANCEQ